MIDWQTEDNEGDWLELPEETAVSSRRCWRWLIPLLFLIALMTWVGFQLAERINNNLQITRDAVRQQHFLTLVAAIDGDDDLFNHLIATSNLDWRVLQQLLLEENLLFDKAPLNFWLDPDIDVEQLQTAVQLSSELTQASVQTIVPYLTLNADGNYQEIKLRHEYQYRKRNGVWIQEPLPEDDFWGQILVYEGEQFEILYPERDSGIVRRMAEDLDALAVSICVDSRFQCEEKGEFRLLFDVEETAVFRLSDNIRTKDVVQYRLIDVPIYTIKLPAPSLIGYPMDEKSFDALYHGYASLFVTQFINNLPSDNPFSHHELLDYLDQLGLVIPAVAEYDPFNQLAPSIDLPQKPLLLTCNENRTSVAWLYSPNEDQWLEIGQPFARFTSNRHVLKPGIFQLSGNEPVENQLLTAVPEAKRPLSLEIVTYQKENDRMAVVAQVSKAHPEQFVFLHDGEEFVFLTTVRKRGHSPMPVTFEGNGRYLSLTNYTYDRSSITLIDLQNENETTRYNLKGTPFERYKWADENWFVLINDRELQLVSPEYDYKKVIYHNNPGCLIGEWVN